MALWLMAALFPKVPRARAGVGERLRGNIHQSSRLSSFHACVRFAFLPHSPFFFLAAGVQRCYSGCFVLVKGPGSGDDMR